MSTAATHEPLPTDPAAKPGKWSPIHTAGLYLALGFAGTLGGYLLAKDRNFHDQLAVKDQEVAAGPFVETGVATLSTPERIVKELGETKPYQFATMYAKASGYLDQIYVDKGDKVKKGALLATIKLPETNSQYDSAVADLKNKRTNSRRMQELFKARAVTDTERDQAVADADMAQAQVARYHALKGYAEIVAPFDGTISARFADPGALVQDAANAQSSALPIVNISQDNKLRVTTYIDQRDAPFIQVGDPAMITLQERPGVQYEARVTRTAGDLDPRSRTMLTEIELDNSKGEIVAGSFVDVTLKILSPAVVQMPSQALVMRGAKAFAVTIGGDDTVTYKPIQIGENDGTVVNVLSGLAEGERVALNVGNNLATGAHVQPNNEAKR